MKVVLPIAFVFTLHNTLYLIPLAGDIDTPINEIEPSLQLIQVYLSTPSILKITSSSKRQLRLLDMYAQRHLHHHFITSQTCRSLRDVDILMWLLDPDSTHSPLAVCSPHEEEKKEGELNEQDTLTENLFHILHGKSSPELSIAYIWSQEIPKKALRQLLENTHSFHVDLVIFFHL